MVPAIADDAVEPLRADVRAPAECDASAFFDGVLARTARARAARPGEGARTLRVVVVGSGDGLAGELVVVEESGRESSPRVVRGATCAAVLDALALVAALSVDPAARAAPAASASAPASASAAASASAKPAASTSAAAGASAQPPSREPPPPPRDAPPRWRFGAALSGASSTASGLVFGGELALDATREGPLGPSLRLGAARSFGARASVDGGSAALTFTTATADLCVFHLEAGRFGARPCARVAGGVLAVEARNVAASSSPTRPWISAGVGARGTFRLVDALALELQVRGQAPFFRERFFLEPDLTVYRAPVVVGEASIGVDARFP